MSTYGPINFNLVREALREGLIESVFPIIETMDGVEWGAVVPLPLDDELEEFLLADIPLQKVVRYNYKARKVIWSLSVNRQPFTLDVDPVNGRVLIGYGTPGANNVVEVRKLEDGSLIQRVESVSGNPIGRVADARFDLDDPDVIYFTDRVNHVLVKHRLSDGSQTVFGTYGSAVEDPTSTAGLNMPNGIGFQPDWSPPRLLVADILNGRVLQIDPEDMSVGWIIFATYPGVMTMVHRKRADGKIAYTTETWLATAPWPGGNRLGSVFYNFYGGRFHAWLPFDFEKPRFTPNLRYVAVALRGWRVIDQVNLKRVGPMLGCPVKPVLLTPWCGESVTTDGRATPPISMMWWKDAMIELVSDQDGTAYIEVPDRYETLAFTGYATSGYGWVEYDSFSVTGGRANPYVFSKPPGVWRLRFVPTASATCSLRVRLM